MGDSWVSVEQAAIENSVDTDALAHALNALADVRFSNDYLQVGLERRLLKDGTHVHILYRRADVEAALALEAARALGGG